MTTNFQFSAGAREDFDNMTSEIGKSVLVKTRNDVLNYEGQEGTSSGYSTGTYEIVFIQELDSQNEMLAAGELQTGDVKFHFKSDSVAEEEGVVVWNTNNYKIITLTEVSGENDEIIYIKAYGKKLANR